MLNGVPATAFVGIAPQSPDVFDMRDVLYLLLSCHSKAARVRVALSLISGKEKDHAPNRQVRFDFDVLFASGSSSGPDGGGPEGRQQFCSGPASSFAGAEVAALLSGV
jgi:hypothetical protein